MFLFTRTYGNIVVIIWVTNQLSIECASLTVWIDQKASECWLDHDCCIIFAKQIRGWVLFYFLYIYIILLALCICFLDQVLWHRLRDCSLGAPNRRSRIIYTGGTKFRFSWYRNFRAPYRSWILLRKNRVEFIPTQVRSNWAFPSFPFRITSDLFDKQNKCVDWATKWEVKAC